MLHPVVRMSLLTAICQTGAAPPNSYPQNLGGGGGKVGTLNISWDAMPVSSWNADPLRSGYIVSWKRWDMEDDQWDTVSEQLLQCDDNGHFWLLLWLRYRWSASNYYDYDENDHSYNCNDDILVETMMVIIIMTFHSYRKFI